MQFPCLHEMVNYIVSEMLHQHSTVVLSSNIHKVKLKSQKTTCYRYLDIFIAWAYVHEALAATKYFNLIII